MDKDNALVQMMPDDIAFVEQELTKTRKPATMRELAEKLAFRKTANERTQDVKLYDQNCVYLVGDSIYKEYDEHLTVSSKTVEPFKGPVVLTVVNKIFYKGFGEMLEVDYTGGGTFRKYIDYIKKSKTQVLLPSNVGGSNEAPTFMGRENDPRLTELPMLDRDLKTLERHLRTAMAKSPAFFTWGDFWQLTANRPVFPEDKIKEMEAQFTATKESAATGDLVKKFFDLEASNDLFDIHCLGLANLLETKYKKEFVQVSPLDWGKWHLKSVLAAMPENLALAAPEAALSEFDSPEQVEVAPFHAFPLKVYLSWREILSGGVKIPKVFNKDLTHSREYVFTDADDNKSYTVYYFPQQGYFLGLKAFFAAANIPQGTSMTLERKGPLHFHFWLKKSKKKISVAKMSYDPASDMFADAGEAATLAMPNKIIYLERDALVKLIARYGERDAVNLKDLLILVFKHFSLPGANHAMHYLRAYHLVDVLKRTSQEDVEFTLLNSPEFSKSDKKKGIYAYHEALPALEEIQIEAPSAAAGKAAAEVRRDEFEAVPETPIDVIQDGDLDEFEFEIIAPPAAPMPVPEIKAPTPFPAPAPAAEPDAAKKEKPHKKKKGKLDGEKAPKAKKSERRVIEERIEEEESELEALYAEKSQDEEEIEAFETPRTEAPVETAKEAPGEAEAELPAAEEAKPPAPAGPGGMFGNLFAERLKSALTKKRKETGERKPEDKE